MSLPLLLRTAATICVAGSLLSPWPSHAQQVYRCGNHYSQTPCPGGQAVAVQPSATVEVAPAPQPATRRRSQRKQDSEAREWERTERELDKAQTSATPPRSAKADATQCRAKQQRIQKIDDLARKGGSIQKMERLREERQAARDWQFRAGC